LEPSLDNVPAYDDFGRVVGNWLWEHVVMAPDYGPETHIEIEAKIGTLISPTSQHERYQTGVLSEAILCPPQRPEHKPRFESLMSMQQHKLLNEYLNRTAVMAKEPGRAPVDYAHVREIDTFYELPHQFLTQLHPAIQALYTSPARGEKPRRPPRVRVTTDQKTKAVKAVIIKTRLADLEISCPSNSFDYRISISLETKYPHPYDILPEHLEKGISTARAKDRLSYTHQRFQVDLTQVTQLADRASKSHELEVEMDAGVLREEGRKVQQGEENVYERLVGVFLANVRVINR
ncbi:mRNA triphosphatase CET1, partial [Tothia fuscella]